MIVSMHYASEGLEAGKQKLTAEAKDGSLSAQMVVSVSKWTPETVAMLLRQWADAVEENGDVDEVDTNAERQ